MILTVTLNPCVDHTLFIDGLRPHDANRVHRIETDAGGKGINVSRLLAELGAETRATGFLGGGNGAYVRRVLDSEGVGHEFVEVAAETRANTSVEDGSSQPPTTFSAPGAEVDGVALERLVATVAALARSSSWCVFGGSLPQGVSVDALLMLVAVARSEGAKVVVDGDGEPMRRAMERPLDLIKPNANEASRLLGRPVVTLTDAVAAARELRERMRSAGTSDPVAVVSLGRLGAALAASSGAWQGEALSVETRSTIGSGDSMVAGIVHALEEGRSDREALALGLAAGGATAISDGCHIGSRIDVTRLLAEARVDLATAS